VIILNTEYINGPENIYKISNLDGKIYKIVFSFNATVKSRSASGCVCDYLSKPAQASQNKAEQLKLKNPGNAKSIVKV
jgi:hypothetical protein